MRYGMAGLAALVVLEGCQVGPDFVRPGPPGIATYTAEKAAPPLVPGKGEPAQRLVSGKAIPAAWWRLFRSPPLDGVVRQAIAGSPTIEAAKATLAQAQQAVRQAGGAYYPQVDFAAAVERQRGPAFQLGVSPTGLHTFSLYTLGPTVSFSPDVFGATARHLEQQAALAENQAFQLAAAQLTITGNAVAESLTIASLRLQIGVIEAIIADDERNLSLVRQKFEAGKAPRTDTLTAESQLTNDRARLPPLGQQLVAAEHALTILLGKYPAEWSPPPFDLADFTLPADLPVSLPSALVRQRPDILAAEARLHASSAAIGVAVAQMYPTIILSASVETAALAPASLFQGSGLVWTLLAGLTAPIFHGGALEAQKQGAIEAFRAAFATYRQTVLQAFGQVADTLRALDHDAKLMEAERQALDVAGASVDLRRRGYAAGKNDVLQLLDAERGYQQARLGYARAEAQRYLDSAQLFVAMGGGWWEDRALCSDCRERLSPGAATAPTAGIPSSDLTR
jgi:NodT family efflux transporter outer membrane factor (OMF) lipoprotein